MVFFLVFLCSSVLVCLCFCLIVSLCSFRCSLRVFSFFFLGMAVPRRRNTKHCSHTRFTNEQLHMYKKRFKPAKGAKHFHN